MLLIFNTWLPGEIVFGRPVPSLPKSVVLNAIFLKIKLLNKNFVPVKL